MEKKVLLVDNSCVCLDIEQELLRRLPVKVFVSETGKQALELAHKLRPDLIYMGHDLPGMDGISCCRAIKGDRALAGIQVILMAPPVEKDMTACLDAGCDLVLAKPIDRREFIAAGRSLLALRDQREERVPCRSVVTCRLNGSVFYGTIEDISPMGMYIGSHFEVKVGQQLKLKFVLPVGGACNLETEARVIWINGGKLRRKGHFPVGFGVSFQEPGQETVTQIAEFIERSILWQQLPSEW
ncbi:MAG TPA: response regulator [Geobacteraceae bacterium]|nr:response regulator [Geobacteraceae bacterium]